MGKHECTNTYCHRYALQSHARLRMSHESFLETCRPQASSISSACFSLCRPPSKGSPFLRNPKLRHTGGKWQETAFVGTSQGRASIASHSGSRLNSMVILPSKALGATPWGHGSLLEASAQSRPVSMRAVQPAMPAASQVKQQMQSGRLAAYDSELVRAG